MIKAVKGSGVLNNNHQSHEGFQSELEMPENLIESLNFAEESCRTEIACVVHQADRFASARRINYYEAAKRIIKYLKNDTNE